MISINELAKRNAGASPDIVGLLGLAAEGLSSSEVADVCVKRIEPIELSLAYAGLGYVNVGFTNPILCITGPGLFQVFLSTVVFADLQSEDVMGFLQAIGDGTFIRVQEWLSKDNSHLSDDLKSAVSILHQQLERLGLLQQAQEFEALARWDDAGAIREYLQVRSYFRTRLKYGAGGVYFHQNGLLSLEDFEARWDAALGLRDKLISVCRDNHSALHLLTLFTTFLVEDRASCEAVLYYMLYGEQPLPPDCMDRSILEEIHRTSISLRHAIQQVAL
jgi:hypothetical protein